MVAVSFLREWLDTLMSQAAEGLAFSGLPNERTLPHRQYSWTLVGQPTVNPHPFRNYFMRESYGEGMTRAC